MSLATIAGVGDLVPYRRLQFPRRSLYATLSSAFTVANLEVPLTKRDDPQREGIVLRGDPAVVPDLKRSGIDAASLANNHSGDHGYAGIEDTAGVCTRHHIVPFGHGRNALDAFKACLVPAAVWGGRLDLALVTATLVGYRRYFAGRRPGVAGIRVTTAYSRDVERLQFEPGQPAIVHSMAWSQGLRRLRGAVTAARKRTPLVIAVLHWGVSLEESLTEYQRAVADTVIDAGASVVFGHHSHTLQAVEMRNGVPIFYGLGSFLFSYPGDYAKKVPRETAVALVDVDDRDGTVQRARLLVGRLDDNGEPVSAGAELARYLAEKVKRLSVDLPGNVEISDDALTMSS
jgi:poly-gamma-glutamate capsule biosynthesis protein CapA/YwtB (metallophosphatase superfamily)